MLVPLKGLPVDAGEAQVVLGAAGEVYRREHELPPSSIVSEIGAITDQAVDVDVPFGNEAIVFLSDGGFVQARKVRVGQTFGDPYRVVELDFSKDELTVTLDLIEQRGPDPGDEVQAGAEVEWGDGTDCEEVAPPIDTLTHTYAEPGHYTVHIRFGFEVDPRPSFAHHHIVLD